MSSWKNDRSNYHGSSSRYALSSRSPCVAANCNCRDKKPMKCFNYDAITGEKLRNCKPDCVCVHRYIGNIRFFLTKAVNYTQIHASFGPRVGHGIKVNCLLSFTGYSPCFFVVLSAIDKRFRGLQVQTRSLNRFKI